MCGPGVVAELRGVLGVAMAKFVSDGTLPGPIGLAEPCEHVGDGDVGLVVLRLHSGATLLELIVGGDV